MSLMTEPIPTVDADEDFLTLLDEDEDVLTYGRHSAREAKRETLNNMNGFHQMPDNDMFLLDHQVTVAGLISRLHAERRPMTDDELDVATAHVLLKSYRPGQDTPPADTVGMLSIPREPHRQLHVVSNEDAAAVKIHPVLPDATKYLPHGHGGVGDFGPVRKELVDQFIADQAERHRPHPNPWQRLATHVKGWFS